MEWPWWLKTIHPSAGKSCSLKELKWKTSSGKYWKKGRLRCWTMLEKVNNNQSLLKLGEEVGIREAVVWVAHATGQKPPEFKDHTQYLNWRMEDQLELNKIASATKRSFCLGLIKLSMLTLHWFSWEIKMNVMTEPLHWIVKSLPGRLHVHPSYCTYNCGSQKMTVKLHNTKDHAIIIKKGTVVLEW